MSDEKRPFIVIRRIKKIRKQAHHGGSWKIAYADFVTAMMTFFLLMWLLSMMNHYQLEGIAEYFKKPLSQAFQHQGNQPNKDKNRDKFTEKETEKQKPEKSAEKSTKTQDNPAKSLDKPGKMLEKPPQSQEKPLSLAEKHRVADLDRKHMEELKQGLQAKMEADPELRQFKNQLNFQVTADGLKIELRDIKNKPMFTTGKADFQKYANKIMSWLSADLNKYPNSVVIMGHTDAAQYSDGGYTNWELSADRANSARRALIKYGMDKNKLIRIIGVGDTDLLDKANGLNPSNRRIEILVLTDEALRKLTH